MKSQLLLISALAFAISNATQAQYRVNIPLEANKIVFEDPEVKGEIKLSPTTINRGGSSDIIWNYTYADEINIENIGTFNSLTGSYTISPTESTTYQVLVKSGDKSKTETLNLTVIQPDQDISFNADSYRIGYGSSTNLNWHVSNAESVNINNGIGNQSLSGIYKVTPTTDTTYTLTAKGFTGISDKTQDVNIVVVPDATVTSFNVDKNKITVGDTSTFTWNVENAEAVTLNGESVNKTTGSKSVPFNTAGSFDYKLQTTSLSGLTAYSGTQTVNVYNVPTLSTFTVNGQSTVDVSPNADLTFNWASTDASAFKLNNTSVSGNATQLTASSSTGSSVYTLEAYNEANRSVSKQVTVNVIGDPTLSTITSPSPVFSNSPFTLTWSGSGISKYTVKANNASAGLSTSETDVGTATSQVVIPTTNGTFNYTVAAYNTANAKKEQIKTVVVESDPSMTGLLVNGSNTISVSPNTSLTFATTGMSSGATLVGRDSNNSSTTTLPTVAASSPGTTIYYGTATKTLNSVTRYGALQNVKVTVIAAPTVGTITAPTAVFANAPFTASWTGTDVTSYTIKSNNTGSGISTSDTNLSTNTSTTITPTAAGTYTYTITVTNSVGVTSNKSFTVTVEANPTFSSFLVNGSTSITVATGTALTYTGSGISSGAAYQGRTNGNDGNVTNPANAPTTAGTYTYYMAAAKTLNGVNRYSALRSVTVTVVLQPTIQYLTASPTVVDSGQSSTLSFSTANSSSNEINGVNVGANNTYVVNPTVTTTYTLTAKNAAGETATKTATVTVQNWTATTPVYGSWTNVSGKVQYGCGTWSPSSSTVTTTSTFTQTASCSTDQTRTRQDRVVSSATGEIKNSGAVVTETQTIAQTASRSYTVNLTAWAGSTVSSCASWTPDPSTVASGQSFTQTGVSCSLPQTRTRTESYIDHITGSKVTVSTVGQNQTLTVSGTGYTNGTRTATGTKVVAPVCQYSFNDPKSLVHDITGDAVYVYWDGSFLGIMDGATYLNSGGYKYYAGTKQAIWGAYQVCRTPL